MESPEFLVDIYMEGLAMLSLCAASNFRVATGFVESSNPIESFRGAFPPGGQKKKNGQHFSKM